MFFIVLIAFLFSISPVHSSEAGVSINQTRVIILDGEKNRSVTIKNDGENNYLIQTKIINPDGQFDDSELLATPPLAFLKENGQQTIRILNNESKLPKDRESIFYISIAAIPSSAKKTDRAVDLSMGFRFLIKLFYRPKGLLKDVDNENCEMVVISKRDGVAFKNTSNFYKTIGTLKFDDEDITLNNENSLIAPTTELFFKTITPIRHIKWNLINDYGGLTRYCEYKTLR